MANPEETFDPNDLESIDALLDEAELEAASDVDEEIPESVDEIPVDEPAGEGQSVDEAEAEQKADEPETVPDPEPEIESKVDEVEVTNSEPEVVGVSEPIPEVVNTDSKAKMNSAVEQDDASVDDFLEKRAAAQASQKPNLSVEDMDSIKKLIIIFGSILSVLVITGIGIGVWSALAASSAGVDEDTKNLIESIKVSSEQNGSAIKDSEKITKSVEKKLDAINYQLEQLATDLAAMESSAKEKKEEAIDPLGLQKKDSQQTQGKAVAQQMMPMKGAVAASPEMMKKLDLVSRRVVTAQRRINEINKRLKAMQAQSSALKQSFKVVEKEALITQSEREAKQKAMEEKMKRSQGNPYQYSAPDGGFYDQSVSDSYP